MNIYPFPPPPPPLQSTYYLRPCTDYLKAFDLMDHNILDEKLQEVRLDPSTLNSISDFLKGRLQRVKLSLKSSQTGNKLNLRSRYYARLVAFLTYEQ